MDYWLDNENFYIELSTRPAKSIGPADMWEKGEKALSNALENKRIDYQIRRRDVFFL